MAAKSAESPDPMVKVPRGKRRGSRCRSITPSAMIASTASPTRSAGSIAPLGQDGCHRDGDHGADQQHDLEDGEALGRAFVARARNNAHGEKGRAAPPAGTSRGRPSARHRRRRRCRRRRPDHGRNAPDPEISAKALSPEALGKDDPDHGVAHGGQQPGAEPLHGAANQHDFHVRSDAADQAAEREPGSRGDIGAARAEAEGAGARQRSRQRSRPRRRPWRSRQRAPARRSRPPPRAGWSSQRRTRWPAARRRR